MKSIIRMSDLLCEWIFPSRIHTNFFKISCKYLQKLRHNFAWGPNNDLINNCLSYKCSKSLCKCSWFLAVCLQFQKNIPPLKPILVFTIYGLKCLVMEIQQLLIWVILYEVCSFTNFNLAHGTNKHLDNIWTCYRSKKQKEVEKTWTLCVRIQLLSFLSSSRNLPEQSKRKSWCSFTREIRY